MHPVVVAAVITSAIALLGIILGKDGIIEFWRKLFPAETIKGAGYFGEAVFSWMDLSKTARKKLGRSKFIKIGATRHALFNLVESAKGNYSMLAICGYKGDYSRQYYELNFEKCKAVKRVFSFKAIRNEFEKEPKPGCFALEGLKMHRDNRATADCDVEVFLIPEAIHIRDLGARNFNPPFSFGLAILRDGNDSPRGAVVHWEIDAETLKDLIAIEGVIVDSEQDELLTELAKLHESIAGSDVVLSSKKNPEKIDAICDELDKIWKSLPAAKERGKA